MKKIFSLMAVVIIAATALFSCNKEDNGSTGTYPTHICGAWNVYYDTTGANGALIIKDVLDGQYAALYLYLSEDDSIPVVLDGAFGYDAQTGVGELKNSVVGGYAFTVQAQSGYEGHVISLVVSSASGEAFEMIGIAMDEYEFAYEAFDTWMSHPVATSDTTFCEYGLLMFPNDRPEAAKYKGAFVYEEWVVVVDTAHVVMESLALANAVYSTEYDYVETIEGQTIEVLPFDSAAFYVVDISKFYKYGDGFCYGLFTVADTIGTPVANYYYLPVKTNSSFSQMEFFYEGRSIILNSREVRHDEESQAKKEIIEYITKPDFNWEIANGEFMYDADIVSENK